jgi:UDP-galactopyranose mutase
MTSPQMPKNLLVFSHLRWGFVYQRPQHLLSRWAREHRVFFVEEPMFDGSTVPRMEVKQCPDTKVFIAVPQLAYGLSEVDQNAALKALVDDLIKEYSVDDFTAWYYTPMALGLRLHGRTVRLQERAASTDGA